MKRAPSLDSFIRHGRKCFRFLITEFGFRGLRAATEALTIPYRNPFRVSYEKAGLTVAVEGINWGRNAHVEICHGGTRVGFGHLLNLRDTSALEACRSAAGQLAQLRAYATALRTHAADVLAGDLDPFELARAEQDRAYREAEKAREREWRRAERQGRRVRDALAAKIAAYRTAKLDPNGESSEKCEVVRELKDHIRIPTVLAFFQDLIADPDEYDMARVEALKILQLWKPPGTHIRVGVGRRLAEVLPAEPDVLVQQWMAIAAENFVRVAAVFVAVSAILADRGADLDVRHNCLAAVQRLGPSAKARGVLGSLTADPELGVHVRRILKEWDRMAGPAASADRGGRGGS